MDYDRIRLTSGGNTFTWMIYNGAPSDLYVVKSITGLGAPDLGLIMREALPDRSIRAGRNPVAREIVIRLRLNPNYAGPAAQKTPSALREALYSGLLAGNFTGEIVLSLFNGATEMARTVGYVETPEDNIWSKDPEVQFTFLCTSPFFESPTKTTISNPTPQFVTPSISFINVNNPGSAPAWGRVEVNILATLTTWNLNFGAPQSAVGGGGYREFRVDYSLANGDKLIVDSRPGFREVSRIRSGTKVNIINGAKFGPALGTVGDFGWPEFLPGPKGFYFVSPASVAITLVEFTPRYWGV